ncbi:anti-sigma factor [Amycolatopsis sp. cg5]|uniref:anti-sigma factor n=1 Tax=Amycolatopsis sp. cg5 TaxID=3238802 RepID=UPI0035242F14
MEARHEKTPDSVDELLDEVVELRVPAHAGQLSLVRMLAQGMAARADFHLDAISDAKMAVDEACAELIEQADLGAFLRCRFRPVLGGLQVSVSTTTLHTEAPSTSSFGWHVLATLTESAWTAIDSGPGPGSVVTIEFILRSGTDVV